jgi:hypothetical protein
VNKVILNWQGPLWEGDQEVVKRSGRDEPIWVVIHLCMEAMLGISLYSFLYLKLGKNAMSSLLSPMFSLKQDQRRRGGNGFCLEAKEKVGGRGEGEGDGEGALRGRDGPHNVCTCK